jgi:hypothetical protein
VKTKLDCLKKGLKTQNSNTGYTTTGCELELSDNLGIRIIRQPRLNAYRDFDSALNLRSGQWRFKCASHAEWPHSDMVVVRKTQSRCM